jgi:hypothetical protein
VYNDNSIERMFNQDIQDKRRAARGAFHNSGRRGGGTKGVKGVRTPADMLKYSDKKAYKEYTKASEVIMSNVYQDINNIPSIKEIDLKDFKAGQLIVREAKKHHTSKALMKHWKLSSGSMYKVFDRYEIEYPKRGKKNTLPEAPPYEPKPVDIEETQAEVLKKAMESSKAAPIVLTAPPTPVPVEVHEGFQLSYTQNGVLGSDIQDRVTNYMSILLGDKKYEIKLVLKELP